LDTFQHDVTGRLTQITDRDGLVTQINRNTYGKISSIVNPYGITTQFRMDIAGNLYEIEDPIGRVNRFFYLNGSLNGPMTAMRDPSGNTKYYVYDSSEKLITATNANGGDKTLNLTVNSTNGISSSKVDFATPMGRVTSYDLIQNPSGYVTRTNTLPSGYTRTQNDSIDGMTTEIIESAGYIERTNMKKNARFADKLVIEKIEDTSTGGGDILFDESYTFASPGNPFSISSYHKTTTLGPDVFSSTYNATTSTQTSSSPSGIQEVRVLDAKGRVVTSQLGSLHPRYFTYNTNGQLTSFSQGTRVYSYGYNTSGQRSSVVDPLNNTTTFLYDDANQLLTKNLANGKTVNLQYTPNGEMEELTNSGGDVYSYTFDNNRNVVGNFEPTIGSTSFTWDWDYNADDQNTITTHPDSSVLTKTYNTDGTLATLSATGLSRTYSWYMGVLQGIASTSNVNLTLTGDKRPTSATWQGAINGSVNYGWGSYGRLNSLTVNNSAYVSFAYDSDGALSQAHDLYLTRDLTNGLITASTEGQVSTSHSYNNYGE
ncbi:MAG: RHS repeat protein, partial [Pedobacter sp.]